MISRLLFLDTPIQATEIEFRLEWSFSSSHFWPLRLAFLCLKVNLTGLVTLYQLKIKCIILFYKLMPMSANSLISTKTVLLVLLLAVVLPANKIQKVNGPPTCCDSRLLKFNPQSKQCECNFKQHYYESRNRKHCVYCPPPKLWIDFECRECKGKFREWSGQTCVCKSGTFWSHSERKCVCPKDRVERQGSDLCYCRPPLVQIDKECKCPDQLHILKEGACVCKDEAGVYSKKNGYCQICKSPNHWFAKIQKCLPCNDQGPEATEIYNPQEERCQCNAKNPYRNQKGECQACPEPGAWNQLLKKCICPQNYVWNQRLKKCQCLPPYSIDLLGFCSNCPEGQSWDRQHAKCICPKERPYYYKFKGESKACCHKCPEDKPLVSKSGNCSFCPDQTPYQYGTICQRCPVGKHYWNKTKSCQPCPEYIPYFYNSLCHKCPQEEPFFYKGKCNPCVREELFYNQKCNKCPKALYFYDEKCHKCQKKQYEWADHSCHACPQNKQYFYEDKCNECPEDLPYKSKKHCGCAKCPDDKPYFYKDACHRCSQEQFETEEGKCIECRLELYYQGSCHRCPKGLHFYKDKCNRCYEGQYLVRGLCSKCPLQSPYLIAGTCRRCKQGYQFRNQQCLPCAKHQLYDQYEATCIYRKPQRHPKEDDHQRNKYKTEHKPPGKHNSQTKPKEVEDRDGGKDYGQSKERYGG